MSPQRYKYTRVCVVALDALTQLSVRSLWSSGKFLNQLMIYSSQGCSHQLFPSCPFLPFISTGFVVFEHDYCADRALKTLSWFQINPKWNFVRMSHTMKGFRWQNPNHRIPLKVRGNCSQVITYLFMWPFAHAHHHLIQKVLIIAALHTSICM